mmetsp:Transcript_4356/g.15362  ORF Transcript_4356/g.15362 Transcript_4356/m.15362 type:complete len:401 (-) Transcript_4356:1532-2734(-)
MLHVVTESFSLNRLRFRRKLFPVRGKLRELRVVLLIIILGLASKYLLTSHKLVSVSIVPVSIVTPATYVDFVRFAVPFVESIRNGYYHPHDIIIVVSDAPVGRIAHSETLSRTLTQLFQGLSSSSSSEVVVKLQPRPSNQARNRNIGVQYASQGLILFFDIDDEIYPWGLYSVIEAYTFNTANASAVMFAHSTSLSKPGNWLPDVDRSIAYKFIAKVYTIVTGLLFEQDAHFPPDCSLIPPSECDLVREKKKRVLISTETTKKTKLEYVPLCSLRETPCSRDELYSSSKFYEECFSAAMVQFNHSLEKGRDTSLDLKINAVRLDVPRLKTSKVNWCCMTDVRPLASPGWLFVRREEFTSFEFNEEYDTAEDGDLIGRMLVFGQNVVHIDIPIGYRRISIT